MVGAFQQTNDESADEPQQQQAALVIPASPSPVPSPTLDIQATQMVQQTDLTNAQAELAQVNLQIEQTNLAIQESKEREAQALASIAQNEAEKFATNLKITEEQNRQVELLAEQARLKNEEIALTNTNDELKIGQIEAQAMARNGWLVVAGAGLLGGGMAIGGRALSKAPRKADAQPAQTAAQPAAKSWNKTSNGVGETWQAIAPPLNADAFRPFAEYALSGGLLGINNVCDKACIVSRSDYARYIIPWMQEHDYYGRDSESGGLVLSESGQKDFVTWLRDNPPPLLDNLSQSMPPTHHDHENHDHDSAKNTEGEGVSDE